ncbi:MAG: phosphoribosylformylglycinamidine cyclo-ligase [Spirochaetales bacterium]|nr:phosphoribosylformylglycinamidine cyclo-ligase [Spirochaetales bacterium]
MKPKSYEEAGVNISKGDSFANFIASLSSPALSKDLGGFAGGIEIDTQKYTNPILLSATDGVGTKLLVARSLGIYDTLGIDLVAMCVNDLIVCGAEPQVFLDYIATGRIEEDILHALMRGIVRGCEDAQCVLAGGETAEMPDVYGSGDFDLAGFATGLVDKTDRLPKPEVMNPGDLIYGIPSSGIHSNGLSLARKVLSLENPEIATLLLTPTRIYVRHLKSLFAKVHVSGAAHITGGGLEGNFSRLLPRTLKAEFTWNWPVPPIFDLIQKEGDIEQEEMRKVFNMGIGIAFIIPKEEKKFLEAAITSEPLLGDLLFLGTLIDG